MISSYLKYRQSDILTQNKMDCINHQKAYQYVCKAEGCNFCLLCNQCRRSHISASNIDRSLHAASIVSLKHAFEEGETNLKQNIESLKQVLFPFQNEQIISQIIKDQTRKLIQERDQIIKQVNDVFDRQITQMQSMNKKGKAESKKSANLQQIKNRISKLEGIKGKFKTNPNDLRSALSHSEKMFISELKKDKIFSNMTFQANQYYVYDQNAKHDFFLSRLELKRKSLKLVEKVYNQSDLYFLIEDYKQGEFLHYFSPGQNLLRLFNLKTQAWKEIKYNNGQLPRYGATLYDSLSGRFYLIGGEIANKKSNSIISYSREEGWAEQHLLTPRSSAMATLIRDKEKNSIILVAGGVGVDGKHLKDSQAYFVKKQKSVRTSAMNFAVTSGCLVTYNDSIALRIGGLGQFKPGVASICEIAQKIDWTQFLDELSGNFEQLQKPLIQYPKWTYMDIEVVNTDLTKKFSLFSAHQGGIQINPNQIFIFGGISHNSQGVADSYIIEIQTLLTKLKTKSIRYYGRWINKKTLISAEGFAGLRPIIFEKKVVSLQNISCGASQIYQKQKKYLQFNMYEWKQISNIVTI